MQNFKGQGGLVDWNSRQKICSPRRCGQFGTLGSTQRPFVQELEVFSQKVFFLKIPICCVCTLLWGQHLEPLSPTVVYPPVPPFGAASGTLEMQYEEKSSFLSENKHKLHFWSYSAWTSIFMTQFVRLLYYLWLFVISSTSGPPLLWTTTSEQVQAILFDIDTAFVPADELNRVRAVLSYAQGKTGLAPSPQGVLKYLIPLLY